MTGVAKTGTMSGIETNITHPNMKLTEQTSLRQRLRAVQVELIDGLGAEMGEPVTPALERLVHTLDWVRIEDFVADGSTVGRPQRERFALANALIAKAVLRLPTTVTLIDRLKVDRALRRICGFAWYKKLPDEATFSRAFAQFAQDRLAERVHEALIKEQLGEQLIGHISRDGTAIEVRERATSKAAEVPAVSGNEATQASLIRGGGAPQVNTSTAVQALNKHRRGRPRRGEVRAPKQPPRIERQLQQAVQQMLDELPNNCDRGVKCNAQGYKISWNGYKLHFDTADCGVPISAVLTSASVHDSQVAVPLSRLSAQRVTNLY
jgi:transposase